MKMPYWALIATVLGISILGCNGVGPKETKIAKINDESIYKEDIYLMLDKGRYDRDSLKLNKLLYERYYGPAALLSKAVSDFPELKDQWDEFSKTLEIRWLTSVYQKSYLMECLGFSDAELMPYYESNQKNYPNADSITGYYGVRSEVAKDYYISKNQELYQNFLTRELPSEKELTSKDTAKVKNLFVTVQKKEMAKAINANILESRHFKIEELPPIDPKAYYEKHQDLYMTVPGYELYHIQNKDSLKLAGLFNANVDLNSFKEIALKNSSNASRDSGYVGVVKKGYAIPYGVGVINGLDTILEQSLVGAITPVVKSSDSSFHRFYVASKIPSQLKPYDRVKPGLVKSIENEELLEVDSSFVLITHNGEPVLTEKDLIKFNDFFVKRPLTKRNHQRLVKMLAEYYAFADLARELKLDKEWEYRAIVRTARIEFIVEHYLDSLMSNVTDDSAKVWFDKTLAKDNPLTKFEDVKPRVRMLASFPEVIVGRDYYMGYRVMYAGKTFNQTFNNLFDRRVAEYRFTMKDRLMAEAYNQARVHLYDSSIPEYKPVVYASNLLNRADSLYKADNKDDAALEYRTLFYAYPRVDSLAGLALYEMADIHNELTRYDEAECEYYAYYKMYPKQANAEKAMFTRGFILNEYLDNDSLALDVLEEFVNTYPNSEFKESAVWLMDNIKSGGKLQEELNKKIEENP